MGGLSAWPFIAFTVSEYDTNISVKCVMFLFGMLIVLSA